MSRRDTRMYNKNRFKLGLFGPNCSGGLTMTKAPERWDASWENNVAAARFADAIGIEFVLPIARWHGYRGETDTEGTTFETLTWATGLLAATREIAAFGTVHVSLINPVFAAKQIVTADHVGKGRFGLNVVSGWNIGEHDMFGVGLREHDDRYAYTEEWVTIAKKIWTKAEPFDFDGTFFHLKGVLGKPKPWSNGYPILMSAGNSKAGRAFAARHCDALFMIIIDVANLATETRSLRESAGGSPVGVFASGHVMTRPTRQEALDYHHYIVHEMGDWEAAEHAVAIRSAGGGQSIPRDRIASFKERFIGGVGTFPVIGSYDDVAGTFKKMSDAGLDGMAIGLVNYLNDLPVLRDEILPRLERLGIREKLR